jgi:hypothetical protein
MTFLVGSLGETDHHSVVPSKDGGGYADWMVGIAEEVTKKRGLRDPG